jgi:hypothetical protein
MWQAAIIFELYIHSKKERYSRHRRSLPPPPPPLKPSLLSAADAAAVRHHRQTPTPTFVHRCHQTLMPNVTTCHHLCQSPSSPRHHLVIASPYPPPLSPSKVASAIKRLPSAAIERRLHCPPPLPPPTPPPPLSNSPSSIAKKERGNSTTSSSLPMAAPS